MVPFNISMIALIILFIYIGAQHQSSAYICGDYSHVSNNPVIGVIAQERYKNRMPLNDSYIAASYVKFLESAGAQVVPLLLGKSDDYYLKLYDKLNGVLFPGGGVNFNESDYARVAGIFLNKALKAKNMYSEKRRYMFKSHVQSKLFPVWGTCLGMEVIVYLTNNRTNTFFKCSDQDVQSSIQFLLPEDKLRYDTQLFKHIESKDYLAFSEKNITVNYHSKCISLSEFDVNSTMSKHFRVLATQNDTKNQAHVAIMEGKEHPIFAVQFHPEKPMFEFARKAKQLNIPHSESSIRVGQYFANKFIEHARLNCHCFDSHEELEKLLIYNYKPEFVGVFPQYRFEQIYIFPIDKK